MAFERMRILDMAHAWSLGTHQQYQQKLEAIRRFERRFGVTVLAPTPIEAPPHGPEVTLAWSQEQYGLRPGKASDEFVTFGTIRQLRSAASQYFAWDRMITHPGASVLQDNRLLEVKCRPTDDYSATLLATGMSARIGNESNPSQALLSRHVHWIVQDLDERYRVATTTLARRELAQAGFATAALWLGWLRSGELFKRSFSDVRVVEPCDAARVDLPTGVGMVAVSLGLDTKGRRDLCADVVMAYCSYSGIHIGRWFHRLCQEFGIGNNWAAQDHPIFHHADGTAWTSRYFREAFLWPALREQRRQGDRFLIAFDDSPGNTIEEKYWSLHCFRRGARSHVSCRREGMYRKATTDQVYEHARWSRSRQSESIDVLYRQWTYRDRIVLTLYCM